MSSPQRAAEVAAASLPGPGDISVSMPVYVADSDRHARAEAEDSTPHFYRSIARALAKSDAAAWTNEAREGRAQRLGTLTYEDILRDHAVFGLTRERGGPHHRVA
jgi:post-segregation antitoxin (ccd killing protein)